MTNLGLPQGAMQAASSLAASHLLGSDRSPGNQRNSDDGSAFVSFLGALDDAAQKQQGASPIGDGAAATPLAASSSAAAGPWRAPATDNGDAGGWEKWRDSTSTLGENPAPGASTIADKKSSAWDGSTSSHTDWAKLIHGASGSPPPASPTPPVATPPILKALPPRPPGLTIEPGALATAAPATLTRAAAAGAAKSAIEATAEDQQPGAPKVDAGADPSTLTTIGWASLILSASGAPAAAQGAGAAGHAALPTDATLATSALPGAAHAATAPVDVKVVRSITYLGLDPATRGLNGGETPAGGPTHSAPADVALDATLTAGRLEAAPAALGSNAAARGADGGRSRSAATAGAAAAEGQNATGAAADLASAQAASSKMSGGEQSPRNFHGGASGHASGELASAAANLDADVAAAGRAPAGVADASLAAMLGDSAAAVPLAGLGDVIASAAGELDSQSGVAATTDAGGSARTAPIKELDVQLNPASLGALSIEMRLTNGKLAVTIKADKPDTLKLIENERGSLSSKLESLNFSVESLNIKASDAPSANGAGGNAAHSGMAGNGNGEAQQGQQGQAGQFSEGAQGGRSLRGGGQQQAAPQSRDVFAEPVGVNNLGDRVV